MLSTDFSRRIRIRRRKYAFMCITYCLMAFLFAMILATFWPKIANNNITKNSSRMPIICMRKDIHMSHPFIYLINPQRPTTNRTVMHVTSSLQQKYVQTKQFFAHMERTSKLQTETTPRSTLSPVLGASACTQVRGTVMFTL